MSIISRILQRGQRERDAAEEIECHIEEKIAELEESGIPREQAEHQARREFGNTTIIREDSRAVWRCQPWDNFRQDLRFALRWMRGNPGFFAIAILSLGTGIGANTAIFSVVKAMLLNPLPFRDPGRVMLLWTEDSRRGIHEEGTGYLTVQDWKQRSRSFEDIALCSRGNPVFLTGADPPEYVASEVVSWNLFPLLGAAPVLGRTFNAQEEANRQRVVVLSYPLWLRAFGGTRDTLGKTLDIDGKPHEVIGVMPRDFFFPTPETQLWRPLTLDPFWDRQRSRRYTDWWLGVGRLRLDVSVSQAQDEMNGIGRQLEREYPTSDLDFAGFGVNVVPMLLQVVGKKTPFLLAVLSASVFVLLLIACSNLAQLLLARGVARQHEFALRRALGASRGRLIRQLLSESILLSAFACVTGLTVAFYGVRLLLALAPAGIPRLQEIAIDGPVLVFTALVSVAAAILLGLAPAIQHSRIESDGHASAGRSRARTRGFLVGCEFAMGVVLLFTATLLVRSYIRVQSVDPGYRADHLLMARITRSSNTSSTPQDFYPRLLDRMKGFPGVTGAATIQQGFFIDWNPDQVITTEEQSPGSGASASSDQLSSQSVSPGYFRTMNIPLLKGRLPEDGERDVAVINSEMARRYWPGKDPIGKRFKKGMPASRAQWKTVVGLVANTRQRGKEIAPIPEYYWLGWGRDVEIVVRTESSPLQLASALRSEVRGMDNNAAVTRISTMEQRLDELLAPRRFETLLLTLFSAIAVILAAIGIYGATYYAVGQRVKEIGIRIALGAGPASVITMLLRQTARVALIGITVGLALSFGFSRTLTSLLYEIAPADPIALTVVPAVLILVAVCAALIPASRATRIDPIVALRHE